MIFPTQIELNDLILKKPSTEFAGQVADLVLRNQEEFKFIPWTRGQTTLPKAEESLKSMAEKWEKLRLLLKKILVYLQLVVLQFFLQWREFCPAVF